MGRSESGFDVDVFCACKVHSIMFLMGGCSETSQAGESCPKWKRTASEKSRKISSVRGKYSQWWLALVEHIGDGLDDFDREMFRDHVSIKHAWGRIVIIDPRDPARYFKI